jgi:hypothetical protein
MVAQVDCIGILCHLLQPLPQLENVPDFILTQYFLKFIDVILEMVSSQGYFVVELKILLAGSEGLPVKFLLDFAFFLHDLQPFVVLLHIIVLG